ncbi:MAG: hypothetical protein IPK71_04010 [Myxococcales bacterium]|nr:hypothetical protein [Myxococcales bacterium]
MSNTRTRDEADLVAYERLTGPQQEVVRDVLELLAELASHASSSRTRKGPRPLFVERRRNSAILIDGRRGDGKTTALFWVLGFLHARLDRCHHGALGGADLKPRLGTTPGGSPFDDNHFIVPLPFLDLYPLSDDTNILLLLLLCIHNEVKKHLKTEHADLDAKWHADLDAKWQSATRSAVARAQSSTSRATGDLDLDAWRIEDSLSTSLQASASVGDFVDAAAEILRTTLRLATRPLFLLTVDDADMQPQVASTLLRVLRGFYHPNVAFLLTGDSELFKSVQTARFLEWMWMDSKLPGDYRYVDAAAPERAAVQLATELYERTIPPTHRRRIKHLGPSARLVQELDRTPGADTTSAPVPSETGAFVSLQEVLKGFSFPPEPQRKRSLLDLFILRTGPEQEHIRLVEVIPDRPRSITDLIKGLRELAKPVSPSLTETARLHLAANIIFRACVERSYEPRSIQKRLLDGLTEPGWSDSIFRHRRTSVGWSAIHVPLWDQRISDGPFPCWLRSAAPTEWRATYQGAASQDVHFMEEDDDKPTIRRALPPALRDGLVMMADVSALLGDPVDPSPVCLRQPLVWTEHLGDMDPKRPGTKPGAAGVPGGMLRVRWPLPEWETFYEHELFSTTWRAAIHRWRTEPNRQPMDERVFALIYIFSALSVGVALDERGPTAEKLRALDVVDLTEKTLTDPEPTPLPLFDIITKRLVTPKRGSRDPIRTWVDFIRFFGSPESGVFKLDKLFTSLASLLEPAGEASAATDVVAPFSTNSDYGSRRRRWLRMQLEYTWVNRSIPEGITEETLLTYFSVAAVNPASPRPEASEPGLSDLFGRVSLPDSACADFPYKSGERPHVGILFGTARRQLLLARLQTKEGFLVARKALEDIARNDGRDAAALHNALVNYLQARGTESLADIRRTLVAISRPAPNLSRIFASPEELMSAPDRPHLEIGPLELAHRLQWDLEVLVGGGSGLPSGTVGPLWPAFRIYLRPDWVTMWPTPDLTSLFDVEALSDAWTRLEPRAQGTTTGTLAMRFYARVDQILERRFTPNEDSWEAILKHHAQPRGREAQGEGYVGPRWEAYKDWRREVILLAAPESELSPDDAESILTVFEKSPSPTNADFEWLEERRVQRLVEGTKRALGATRSPDDARSLLRDLDRSVPDHPWVKRQKSRGDAKPHGGGGDGGGGDGHGSGDGSGLGSGGRPGGAPPPQRTRTGALVALFDRQSSDDTDITPRPPVKRPPTTERDHDKGGVTNRRSPAKVAAGKSSPKKPRPTARPKAKKK